MLPNRNNSMVSALFSFFPLYKQNSTIVRNKITKQTPIIRELFSILLVPSNKTDKFAAGDATIDKIGLSPVFMLVSP